MADSEKHVTIRFILPRPALQATMSGDKIFSVSKHRHCGLRRKRNITESVFTDVFKVFEVQGLDCGFPPPFPSYSWTSGKISRFFIGAFFYAHAGWVRKLSKLPLPNFRKLSFMNSTSGQTFYWVSYILYVHTVSVRKPGIHVARTTWSSVERQATGSVVSVCPETKVMGREFSCGNICIKKPMKEFIWCRVLYGYCDAVIDIQ
jgi:hypothetical protein